MKNFTIEELANDEKSNIIDSLMFSIINEEIYYTLEKINEMDISYNANKFKMGKLDPSGLEQLNKITYGLHNKDLFLSIDDYSGLMPGCEVMLDDTIFFNRKKKYIGTVISFLDEIFINKHNDPRSDEYYSINNIFLIKMDDAEPEFIKNYNERIITNGDPKLDDQRGPIVSSENTIKLITIKEDPHPTGTIKNIDKLTPLTNYYSVYLKNRNFHLIYR